MVPENRLEPSAPRTRQYWECRYSSCEMMYLEFAANGEEMLCFLDHSPHHAEHWAFADVLKGAMDQEVRNPFGDTAVDELKAAVRDRIARAGQKKP
jgi:hypothetical protein